MTLLNDAMAVATALNVLKGEDMASRSQPCGDAKSAATDAEPSAAFTPGPWGVWESRDAREHDVHGPTRWRRSDADVGIIVRVPHYGAPDYHDEQTANARLIAAAPDLYEALSEVRDWIAGWSPNFEQDDEWPATKRKMLAALSKAEGRS